MNLSAVLQRQLAGSELLVQLGTDRNFESLEIQGISQWSSTGNNAHGGKHLSRTEILTLDAADRNNRCDGYEARRLGLQKRSHKPGEQNIKDDRDTEP